MTLLVMQLKFIINPHVVESKQWNFMYWDDCSTDNIFDCLLDCRLWNV